MQSFTPFVRSRLTLARQRRGLRKNELAARTDIDRRTLTGYELGEYAPSPEQMDTIARVLRFRTSFFSREPIEQISEDNASFRALSRSQTETTCCLLISITRSASSRSFN